MNKIFPHPVLSLFILLMWLLLSGFTVGQFLIGLGVALFGGMVMVLLDPPKVRIQNWHLLPLLFYRVVVDITISNLTVAYIIVTGRRTKKNKGFMFVPLDLRNRTALAVLGSIVTATPGTVWVAYDSKSSRLMLHVLDLHDETYWCALIKNRYERLLLEIFS